MLIKKYNLDETNVMYNKRPRFRHDLEDVQWQFLEPGGINNSDAIDVEQNWKWSARNGGKWLDKVLDKYPEDIRPKLPNGCTNPPCKVFDDMTGFNGPMGFTTEDYDKSAWKKHPETSTVVVDGTTGEGGGTAGPDR